MHPLANRIQALEARTAKFAGDVRNLSKNLPQTIFTMDDIRQVIRSSGSVGANYIEANEALGRKDFLMHVRISRKEAKESAYWLRMLQASALPDGRQNVADLCREANELERIFAAIIRTVSERQSIIP